MQQLGVTSKAEIVEWTGLSFAATFLGTGITAPIWGHLGDRYGRKTMLIRAAIGMTLVTPLLGLVHTVHELTALRLLAGLVGGYSSSSTQLVASHAPRERSAWALGILSTGSLAGNLLGPLVGGILPHYIGIRNVFFLAGGMIAIATLATIFLVKEEHATRIPARPERDVDTRHTLGSLDLFDLLTILTTAMMVLFANMSVEPIITLYLQSLGDARGSEILHSGMVMSAAALGSILTAPYLGKLADRIGPWKVIERCLLVTSLLLIPQAMVTRWWMLLILRFLMGMSIVGLLPAIAKLIRAGALDRALGKTLGLSQSSQYAGQVLGPIVGGLIGAHIGMRAVFPMTSAILLFTFLLNRVASKRQLTALTT